MIVIRFSMFLLVSSFFLWRLFVLFQEDQILLSEDLRILLFKIIMKNNSGDQVKHLHQKFE